MSEVDQDGYISVGMVQKIKVSKHGHLERFLRVFINFDKTKNLEFSKVRNIIRNATLIMYRKKMTSDTFIIEF